MTRWLFLHPSECFILFTVFTAECVAIVTVNLLSIILFIKNRSLRTRSMYLVMSLNVADLLVGSVSGSVDSFLGQNGLCPFVKFYPVSSEVRIAFDYLILFFPVVSMTNTAMISLERFLGFSCYSISHWGDRKVSYNTPPILGGITLLFVFNCYLCFLHVHSI